MSALHVEHDLIEAVKQIVADGRDCEECDGSGMEPRSNGDACPICGGTGEYAIVSILADLRALLARAEGRDSEAWENGRSGAEQDRLLREYDAAISGEPARLLSSRCAT